MKLILHSYPTPEENLAFEEWLFQAFEEDVLRLWTNPPSVIVGKHQNALAESNYLYCRRQQIPVIRRISGGGTVYHDSGNVNFSFFRRTKHGKMIDYERNLNLIVSSLQSLGYHVEANERHDIYYGKKKVSGNAQHIKKGKALHHGTILYDAKLDGLRKSIKRESGTFRDKGVQSVRSSIQNLRPMKDYGSTNAFIKGLSGELITLGGELATLDELGLETLKLDLTKYKDYDWNFGYSPAYTFTNEMEGLNIRLTVERGGNIIEASILQNGETLTQIENTLSGHYHRYEEVNNLLQSNSSMSPEDQTKLLNCLF